MQDTPGLLARQPLVSHQNWRFLLRDLLSKPAGRILAGQPTEAVKDVLAGPVTLALWIQEFMPELASRESLHVVIANGLAQSQESADTGRWYQLVPTLLGVPEMQLTVDFVSDHFPGSTRDNSPVVRYSESPLSHLVNTLTPAEIYVSQLSLYLNSRKNRILPDLIILAHPRFLHFAEDWLKRNNLRKALTGGIPVGVWSAGEDDHMVDIWMLDAFGYASEPKVVKSQFEVESPWNASEEEIFPSFFGQFLWKIAAGAPAQAKSLDTRRRCKLNRYEAWLECACLEGLELPSIKWLGAPISDIAGRPPEGTPMLALLPNGSLVNLEDGEELMLEDNEIVPTGDGLPDEVVEAYPKDSPFDFERALWAIDAAEFLDESENEEDDDGEGDFSDFLRGLGIPLEQFAQFMQAQGSSMQDDAHEVGPALTQEQVLFFALQQRRWDSAEAQIQSRPELIHAVDDRGRTPLYFALNGNQFEFAEKLLTAGANPNHAINCGHTVIHAAAQNNQPHFIDLLLRWKGDINGQNESGWTPLLLAMAAGATEAASRLVTAGADLHKANSAGMTPALMCDRDSVKDVVRQLIAERLAEEAED